MQSDNCTFTFSSMGLARPRVLALNVLAALLAAFALAAALCVPQALAKQTVEMPDGYTVSDDVTRVHVNKMDAGTHEHVKGATMTIIERDTGTVVDEWTTDGSTHELEKTLNVNTTYILRELKAPEGYDKAEDTVFTVNEVEGVGLTIASGADAELTNGYLISLYDRHQDIVQEKTVTKTRGDSRAPAPRTGDETPLALFGALALAAALAIVALQLAKRRLS